MKNKISVILPVYNSENYILDTLNSIKKQTYNEIELIIINDACTDSTNEIIKQFMTDNQQININYIVNGMQEGVSVSRNIGIKHASGNFISFIDSDDLIPTDYYRSLLDTALKNNADFVTSSVYRFIREVSEKKASILHRRAFKKSYKNTDLLRNPRFVFDSSVWNKLYRTDFLIKNNIIFKEKTVYEDLLFSIQCYTKAQSVSVCYNLFYFWRIRKTGDSITQNMDSDKNFYDRMKIINEIVSILESYDFVVYKAYKEKLLVHDLFIFIENSINMGVFNKQKFNSIKSILERINYNFNLKIPNELHLLYSRFLRDVPKSIESINEVLLLIKSKDIYIIDNEKLRFNFNNITEEENKLIKLEQKRIRIQHHITDLYINDNFIEIEIALYGKNFDINIVNWLKKLRISMITSEGEEYIFDDNVVVKDSKTRIKIDTYYLNKIINNSKLRIVSESEIIDDVLGEPIKASKIVRDSVVIGTGLYSLEFDVDWRLIIKKLVSDNFE
ncbi:glycosyltransferase family 2 protein [Enterococcus thailandicus]|uniref:glycosyltransferase family 2 protein n=1 Tax=Enterococcus thailandicus TaxID=417368 RepID=UPI003984F1D8